MALSQSGIIFLLHSPVLLHLVSLFNAYFSSQFKWQSSNRFSVERRLKKIGIDTLGTAFTPSAAAVSQSLPQRVDLPDSTPSVPAGNLSFWEKQT
ncbi:hypothetical protein PGTUg99_010233 [Puccinia graminis f. sp. tritici]|uniref:Uncharacterized protein n=1 Tax=Puccinia graminis f. sp. tritici TaxID=56615 RepID=A0A5B0S066_PUCGR|nr:hypothetical protein PGTUg99_010233 [Puccinia graminis f. sp. tritici]